MQRVRLVLFVSLLVLSSTALLATDGVIEINQARATAGGVTPGDTAGFPVTLSQSGSYRLTGNLVTTSTTIHVIQVTASDVTIDLNGFTITGIVTCSGTSTNCSPASGTGDGVQASTGVDRVTVRNGSITGMGRNGVELNAYSHVENIRASQNVSSGITADHDSLIANCITDYNAGHGIFAIGVNSVIQNSTSSNNKLIGIGTNGSGGVISGCTSRANGGFGFSAGADVLVTSCNATGNVGVGLSGSTGATAAVYSNCLFSGNASTGAEVSGGVQIGTNICNGAACP